MLQRLTDRHIWKESQPNKKTLLIDLALSIVVLLLFITNNKPLFFHLAFILLIYGTFFWSRRTFLYHTSLWIPIITIALLIAARQNQTSNQSLLELPLFLLILLIVFATAQKRTAASTALYTSEQQYRRLVELAFEAVIIIVEEKFAFANTQAIQLFKASHQENLIGQSISKYLHPISFEGFKTLTQGAIKENGELPLIEEQLIRPDNTYTDIEAAGLVITYQDQPAILLGIRDISERKLAEAALRESNTRFRELLESVPDAVIVTHKDGTIMLVNKQAEAMFGYNREELVGEFVEKLLPKDLQEIHVQHRDDYASAPRLRKMGTGLDFAGKRKDGSEFPLDIKLSPLFIEEELQTMAIIRDITERKQAEEHVFQAARLAALGQMATALAHELNNPLQIIQGYLDIILDFPINVDEEQSYLQIIRQQIDRLHDVSQGILNYAQPKQKAHQLVDLADTISQVLTLADKQLQHSDTRVVTDIENVPPVLALPDSLVQVFLNLTINAIESFDDNKGLLHIALKSNNGQVNASFRTNGPSIAAKDLPHIFEPFYTTKPGGNGLGLWICRDLVEQYQGTLLAENLADGQGVVFTATFPASSRIVEDDE